MEFQTPIKEHSMVFKALNDLKRVLSDGIANAETDFVRLTCTIELNECEKVLDLIEEHCERYEIEQVLNEQLQKQAHGEAFRYGSPFEEN